MISCSNNMCENVTGRATEWIMISFKENESPSYYCSQECLELAISEKAIDSIRQEIETQTKAPTGQPQPQISPYEYKEFLGFALSHEKDLKLNGVASKDYLEILDDMLSHYEKFLEKWPSSSPTKGEDSLEYIINPWNGYGGQQP